MADSNLKSINGVIDDGPRNAREIQWKDHPVQTSSDGRPTHQCAVIERYT